MIFEPTHSYGTGKAKIDATTMIPAILVANKVGGSRRHNNIALIICGVYGVDVPWHWHLERIIETKYPPESFDNPEWVQTFIDFYIEFINKIAQEVFDTTGVYLGVEGHKLK